MLHLASTLHKSVCMFSLDALVCSGPQGQAAAAASSGQGAGGQQASATSINGPGNCALIKTWSLWAPA